MVVEWWPPGEGRSIFGPPVGPFLPAMISTRRTAIRPLANWVHLKGRSQPTLLSLFIDAANFVSPIWFLSRLTKTTSLRSVGDHYHSGSRWESIRARRSQFPRTNPDQTTSDLGSKWVDIPIAPRAGTEKLRLSGEKGPAFSVSEHAGGPPRRHYPPARRDPGSAMLEEP